MSNVFVPNIIVILIAKKIPSGRLLIFYTNKGSAFEVS
jgi:hypothetical protein